MVAGEEVNSERLTFRALGAGLAFHQQVNRKSLPNPTVFAHSGNDL